jgi:hypothetical protein
LVSLLVIVNGLHGIEGSHGANGNNRLVGLSVGIQASLKSTVCRLIGWYARQRHAQVNFYVCVLKVFNQL